MVLSHPWRICITQSSHPAWSPPNTPKKKKVKSFFPCKANFQQIFQYHRQINHTELRVKKVQATPSSVFHILAEPSVEVVAKNSESRLSDKHNQKFQHPVMEVSNSCTILLKGAYIIAFTIKFSTYTYICVYYYCWFSFKHGMTGN